MSFYEEEPPRTPEVLILIGKELEKLNTEKRRDCYVIASRVLTLVVHHWGVLEYPKIRDRASLFLGTLMWLTDIRTLLTLPIEHIRCPPFEGSPRSIAFIKALPRIVSEYRTCQIFGRQSYELFAEVAHFLSEAGKVDPRDQDMARQTFPLALGVALMLFIQQY